MKRLPTLCFAVVLLSNPFLLPAVEAPPMPAPAKEHEWLQQLAGDWESETEVTMEPGKPPLTGKGNETGRMLGGFWVVVDGKFEMTGMPGAMSSRFTLGYDPKVKKYIGTWVDSMTSYLWKYEGTMDATGRILNLETKGPDPMKQGQISNFRDTIEFKSKDHRIYTSSFQSEDGKWTSIVTINSHRKK